YVNTCFVQSVRSGIVARSDERLRVDVVAPRLARTELDGGKRKDARAATEIDDARTLFEMGVQPFQAQRRTRVRAGSKRETGVQPHDHGTRLGDLLVMRADPEPPAEAQCMKVVEPFTLPDPIGDF